MSDFELRLSHVAHLSAVTQTAHPFSPEFVLAAHQLKEETDWLMAQATGNPELIGQLALYAGQHNDYYLSHLADYLHGQL